jgi:hypothetical protein
LSREAVTASKQKTYIYMARVGDQTEAAETIREIELCPSSHDAILPQQIVENSLTYEVSGRKNSRMELRIGAVVCRSIETNIKTKLANK